MSDFRSVAMRRFDGALGEMESQVASLREKVEAARDVEFNRTMGLDEDEDPGPEIEPKDIPSKLEIEMIEMMLRRMKNPWY